MRKTLASLLVLIACAGAPIQQDLAQANLLISAASAVAANQCSQEAGPTQAAARCVSLTDALDNASAAVSQAQRLLASRAVSQEDLSAASALIRKSTADLKRAVQAFGN